MSWFFRLFIALLLIVSANIVIAQDAHSVMQISGSASLNNAHYDSLKSNGDLVFNNLAIDDLLDVNGSIRGKNLKCRTLKVNGSFEVELFYAKSIKNNGPFLGKNIKITGNAELNGSSKVINSRMNNVKIASSSATFVASNISGDITVKQINKAWGLFDIHFYKSEPQILELKKGSIVSGDIIFEEEGEVHIFDKSHIKGKIFNAKVIRR